VCDAQLLFPQLGGKIQFLGTEISDDAVELFHVTSNDDAVLAQRSIIRPNIGLLSTVRYYHPHTVLQGRQLLLKS